MKKYRMTITVCILSGLMMLAAGCENKSGESGESPGAYSQPSTGDPAGGGNPGGLSNPCQPPEGAQKSESKAPDASEKTK